MTNLECYENIVGISAGACACYPTPPPGYNDSVSGLFLTQLKPFDKLGLSSCSSSDVWDYLKETLEEATKIFIGETNALLLKAYKLQRQPFKGLVGEGRAKYLLNSNKSYAGARFCVRPVRSGVLKINKINTLFEAAGNITLFVYNSLNELLATEVLTTSAGTITENVLATPLELPLSVSGLDMVEYFFIYAYDQFNRPKKNEIACGCGHFKPGYDLKNPHFYRAPEGANSWAKYAMLGAFETDSLISFDYPENTVNSSYLNGLQFDLEFYCKAAETICKDSFNFDSNPLAISVALAIRYKAAELLAQAILNDNTLDFFAVMKSETLAEERAIFESKYDELTGYIIANTNIELNDCFCNKSIFEITSAGIFS